MILINKGYQLSPTSSEGVMFLDVHSFMAEASTPWSNLSTVYASAFVVPLPAHIECPSIVR